MTLKKGPPAPPIDASLGFDFQAMAESEGFRTLVLPLFLELKRRQEHAFYNYTPDDHPDRNQLGFHKSKAYARCLFGGSQSGKSKAVGHEVAWNLVPGSHPWQETPNPPEGLRIYVVSASYRTIQEGVWKHLKYILPEWEVEDVGAAIPGPWTVPTWILMKGGGQVDFLSADGREDARKKAQAAEIDLLVIDEEIDQGLYEELLARLLARGGRLMVSATLMRSEPWCLALEDRALAGDPDVNCFRLDTRIARDRGHVSARQVKEIETHFSAEDVEVRIHGKSRRFQSLVYPEYDPKLNVIDDFEIPRDWTRYCSIDPGWRTCAVLWAAVAPDGKYYLYRELYFHATRYEEVADAIFAAEGYRRVEREVDIDPEHPERGKEMKAFWLYDGERTEEIQMHWIDPSAFGHHETGELRLGHLLSGEYGLAVAPARNDQEVGIELCRRALRPGLDGIPRCRIFRSLANFLLEIRGYRRARDTSGPQQGEKRDAPISKKNHLMDDWRYLELGDLSYVPIDEEKRRREARLKRLQDLETNSALDERIRRRHLRELEEETSAGHSPLPEHVGGLGTEY